MNQDYCKANFSMKRYRHTFKYNNTDVLKLTIIYPIILIPNNQLSQSVINHQINRQISEYYMYVSNKLYELAVETYKDSLANDFPFRQFEAYMEYTITYNQNGFLSLYIDKYEYTGGAHGSTIRSSDTWELCTGAYVPLYCYFKPGTNYRELLIKEIISQADENMNTDIPPYFDNYKDLIMENFNPSSYYLTPEGMAIYYQQYEIAPYATGIVVFIIPYSKIGWYPKCLC